MLPAGALVATGACDVCWPLADEAALAAACTCLAASCCFILIRLQMAASRSASCCCNSNSSCSLSTAGLLLPVAPPGAPLAPPSPPSAVTAIPAELGGSGAAWLPPVLICGPWDRGRANRPLLHWAAGAAAYGVPPIKPGGKDASLLGQVRSPTLHASHSLELLQFDTRLLLAGLEDHFPAEPPAASTLCVLLLLWGLLLLLLVLLLNLLRPHPSPAVDCLCLFMVPGCFEPLVGSVLGMKKPVPGFLGALVVLGLSILLLLIGIGTQTCVNTRGGFFVTRWASPYRGGWRHG